MKKVILLSCLVASTLASNAQYWLSGSSPYTQNFETLGSGLPSGWSVYSGSSATSIGTFETFSTSLTYGVFYDTTCGASNANGGGFKNFASASAITAGLSCTAQQTITNRALGVHQIAPGSTTHPNLDSGAAFVFEVSNTAGITNLGVSFHLQSLDTAAPRATTWILQYKIGASGAWTTQSTTGTMTTGGHTFSDNVITANFGTALDNQSSNVWLRLVTLVFSSGTGNRTCTAIDSFKMTWTGRAGINDVAAGGSLPLTVIGEASANSITFGFDAEETGNYTMILTDLAGRKVYSQEVDAHHGTQNVTVSGLSLTPGMYIARLTNGTSTGFTKVMVN